MEVKRELTVNASAQTLWKILGEDYDRVGEWTSEVPTSKPNPDLPEGQGRVCSTEGFGDAKETITEFSPRDRVLAYTAEIEKMPFFVKEMGNRWEVVPRGDKRALVKMHLKGRLLPVFAQLMGPVMKKQMAKSADTLLEELKYYAETGDIHPRKKKQLNNQ
ncbi:MAG: SRPBCC family protein [Ardenticatenaceae bacterium]|nr:SRPBCC family protein [Ardenticatenaceae bacterium]